MIATFCGHRDIVDRKAIEVWLMCICHELTHEGIDTYYLGGYGCFDRIAIQTVRRLKQETENITSVLILPYLNTSIDTSLYDETLYPPLESVPPRYAISRRNEWMITQADVVVACVMHPWGGAAKALQYAQRKQKRVILYDNNSDI